MSGRRPEEDLLNVILKHVPFYSLSSLHILREINNLKKMKRFCLNSKGRVKNKKQKFMECSTVGQGTMIPLQTEYSKKIYEIYFY